MRDQRGFVEAKTRKLWKREEEEDEDEEDEEDERRVWRTFFLLGNNKLLDLNFFLSFFLSLRIKLSRDLSFFRARERRKKEFSSLPSSLFFNAIYTVSRNSRCLRLTSRFRSRPARRSPTPTLRSDRTRLNRERSGLSLDRRIVSECIRTRIDRRI